MGQWVNSLTLEKYVTHFKTRIYICILEKKCSFSKQNFQLCFVAKLFDILIKSHNMCERDFFFDIFFLKLIVACRLFVIYVKEDNDSNG